MDIKDIPVHVVGPGSQPVIGEDQNLSYLNMPDDMATFVKPSLTEPEELERLPAARAAIEWLRSALRDYRAGSEPMLANLDALDAASRDLVNQILGEGEVSITCSGDVTSKTQESVLAGVWRTLYLDDSDRIGHDILEVADAPHVLHAEISDSRPIAIPEDKVDNPELANALPLLVELRSHCETYERDGTPHSLNLSLLPLSEAELEFLDERLGRGPVDLLSRSYGKCQVISTKTPNVWWVRYYNSMGILILNSLEVVDVPEVVKAAPEDLRDSATRLDDILEPYLSDVG